MAVVCPPPLTETQGAQDEGSHSVTLTDHTSGLSVRAMEHTVCEEMLSSVRHSPLTWLAPNRAARRSSST